MTAFATIKLTGHLAFSLTGEDSSTRKRLDDVMIEVPTKLGDAMSKLQTEYRILLERDSVLILINGVEANALDDLDTVIKSGDNVVIVPMFHGGKGEAL